MRVLLADDHTIVRDGIRHVLMESHPDISIVDVSSSEELIQQAKKEKWDVIVTDISMPPGKSGLEAIQEIKKAKPDIPILVLSMHAPAQYALQAIKSGASGYLTKGVATLELVKALETVVSGKKYLSPEVVYLMADFIEHTQRIVLISKLSDREKEVFRMLATGMTTTEIAKSLSLSHNTISTFRGRIFEKMGFHSNVELIKYAIANKII